MGRFFEDVFLPVIKKLVEAGLSYDDGEATGEDPEHLGGQDHRRAVPGASDEGAQRLTDRFADQTRPTPTSMSPTNVSGA